MSNIAPGEAADISYQAYTYAEDLFPQIKLYKPGSDTAVETINLAHVENGFYKLSFTPDGADEYLSGNVIVYTDATYAEKYEGYDPKPYEITVKRFAQGMASGGTQVLGAMPEDLDKLEKRILEILMEIKEELSKKVDKGEIKIPEPIEQVRQSFKLDRDIIVKAVKDIKIPEPTKQDTKILKEIKDKIDNLPEQKEIDLSGIIKKIESLDIPRDRTNDIFRTIKGQKLKKIEDVEKIKELFNQFPELKKNLLNALMEMDDLADKRFQALLKVLEKIVPNLRVEFSKGTADLDRKFFMNKVFGNGNA